MHCGRIRDLLSDYIDGQLKGRRLSQVESHLKSCASCSAELSDLRRALDAVRSLPELDLPAGFEAALHVRLIDAETAQREAAAHLGAGAGAGAGVGARARVGAGVGARVGAGAGAAGGGARGRAVSVGRLGGFGAWLRDGFRRPAWRGAFAAVACVALVFSIVRYTVPGWDGNVWSLINMARGGNVGAFGVSGPEGSPPPGAGLATDPAPQTGTDPGAGRTPAGDVAGKGGGDTLAGLPPGVGALSPEVVSTLGGAQIIRTASLVVEIREFEAATREVEDIVAAAGGYIEQSSLNLSAKTRSGYFRVRVPEGKFSETIRKLEELGKPLRRDLGTEDVTAPIMDLEARLSTLRGQELRLIQLQGQAKTLDEVLRVENELSRVRYQIEAYEAQLRYYRSRVSLATISLNLSEPGVPVPPPVPGADLWYRIWQAFVATWKGIWRFTEALFVFIASVAPVVAILAVAWWGFVRYRHRDSRSGRGPGA